MVNFCADILILNLEENMQQRNFLRIMLYYFKKGRNATETPKKISAVQKWFVTFLGTTDILAK